MLRIVLCLGCFLYTTAWADLTVEGTHTPGIYGGTDREVIYLRNDEMRIDMFPAADQEDTPGDHPASSVLIRFSGRPSGLLYLDHESKRVQTLSTLRETGATQSANDASRPPASSAHVVKQNQTMEILGHTAYRYDFSFTGNVDPLVLLGDQLPYGMAGLIRIKLQVSGTSWVVPGMEGAGELADFFAQLSKRQLAINLFSQTRSETTPELSILSPGLSGALTDIFARITGAGFPLLTRSDSDMQVDMQGGMADLVQGMLDAMGIGGQQSTESVVTAVHTGEVPAELFYDGSLPPGYSLNTPQ